jgi:hypothetical protein
MRPYSSGIRLASISRMAAGRSSAFQGGSRLGFRLVQLAADDRQAPQPGGYLADDAA